MLKTASFSKIYICCGRTDLRKGIDGLSTIVKGQFQMDAFQEDVLFLFCGSKQDRFTALCWEVSSSCTRDRERVPQMALEKGRCLQLHVFYRSGALEEHPFVLYQY